MPIKPTPIEAMTSAQSREAALHGHRALTPILSGIISGGIIGIAWTVGIIVWLFKRFRRARRAKAAGFRSYREFLDPPKLKDPFVIPPDPAVVQGQLQPGAHVVFEKHKDGWHHKTVVVHRANSADDAGHGHGQAANGHGTALASPPPSVPHSASAPAEMDLLPAKKSTGTEPNTYPPLAPGATDSQHPTGDSAQ